jgi:hypothetical protein
VTSSKLTGPTFFIFDADVLLKLAQHPANIEAIRAIAKKVATGTNRVVVPDPVLNAFNREKHHAAETFWKAQRSNIKGLRQLSLTLPLAAKDITPFADRLAAELDSKASGVPETIKAVEDLLANGEPVPTTDKMKSAAADRVSLSNPPARNASNSSINDCIIWEIVKERTLRGEVIFVTDNYKDFSDPVHREKLHPNLLLELGNKPKFCYHPLEGFRKNHIKSVKIVAPLPSPTICPVCSNPIVGSVGPRPSEYGGWTYQFYCDQCHRYYDTGEFYDD